MKHYLLWALALSTLHLLLTYFLFFGFMWGGRDQIVFQILDFPFVTLARKLNIVSSDTILLFSILNSVLWGSVLAFGIRVILKPVRQ